MVNILVHDIHVLPHRYVHSHSHVDAYLYSLRDDHLHLYPHSRSLQHKHSYPYSHLDEGQLLYVDGLPYVDWRSW
jgi:hypothetical protein